jgi:predicted AAA+ superfamily ATPase
MATVTDEKVYSLLQYYNPWWQSGAVNEEFVRPFKRLAYYDAEAQLKDSDFKRAVILLGARRVGKTTIEYQLIDTLLKEKVFSNKILFFALDHPILRAAGLDNILRIYHENVYPHHDAFYFIDEIHKEENWENWLKALYDLFPQTRMVVTGSASAALSKGSTESGVGRFRDLSIPTLSFFEYCELLGLNANIELPKYLRPSSFFEMERYEQLDVMRKLNVLQNHFNRYLKLGGFPEPAQAKSDLGAYQHIRVDIIEKVLKQDIVDVYKVRNVADLERIFLYICNVTSNVVSIEAMCKELNGVSRPTAEEYIEHMISASLIYKSLPIGLGSKAVLKSSPKLYVADSAIRNAILMDDVLTNPNELGKIVETMVFKHVYNLYRKQLINVGYYRDGKEIDIVVDETKNKIFIESKYRNQAKLTTDSELSKQASMAEFAFVMTKRSEDFGIQQTKDNVSILRIPTFAFLYLLGHSEKHGKAKI